MNSNSCEAPVICQAICCMLKYLTKFKIINMACCTHAKHEKKWQKDLVKWNKIINHNSISIRQWEHNATQWNLLISSLFKIYVF